MIKQRGFSLIELMVVVAIVAILASVAGPLYNDYVLAGKATQATAGLTEGRIKLEQYYQDHQTYANTAGFVSPCPAATNSFVFNCVTAATTYTITATGVGGSAGFMYDINQNNVKNSLTPWGGGACWLTKKGAHC